MSSRARWLAVMGIGVLLAWGLWSLRGRGSGGAAVAPVRQDAAGEPRPSAPANAPAAPATDEREPAPTAAVEPAEHAPRPEVAAPAEDSSEERIVFFARVVDGTNDAPIGGARAAEDYSGTSAVSDSSGLLELRVPALRPGSFELQADGYGMRRFVPSDGHERPDAARTLVLLPVASLRVTVRDEGTEPLDSLRVRLSARSWELDMPDTQLHLGTLTYGGRDGSWTARCAADGTCALTDLPPRVPFEVELLREGKLVLKPNSFGLEPGEVREVEWRLGGGARVVGEVRDQDGATVVGCPLGRFPASVGPQKETDRWMVPEHAYDEAVASVVSDANGRFVFDDVAPGTWWIGPRPPEGDASEVAAVLLRVEVPEGVAEQFVDLCVERGLFIRGRVTTPDGEVPKHAWVTASAEATSGAAHGQMRDDATFELGPLPAATHVLTARSFGDYAPSREVSAVAGDEEVVMLLQRAGTLAGRVVDARDGAGRQAQIALCAIDVPFGNMSTGTQADGSFEISGLGEGTYSIAAISADGLVASLGDLEVRSGSTNAGLVLELRPGARVDVRYNGPAEYCQFGVSCGGALFRSDGLKTGDTAVVFVPAGQVEVVFRLSGQLVETQRATLELGGEHVFTFEPDDR